MLKKLVGECDCGSVATNRNAGHEWICDRCRELQRISKEVNEHYANYGRRSPEEELKAEEESPVSIAQDAINRLERMLQEVQ